MDVPDGRPEHLRGRTRDRPLHREWTPAMSEPEAGSAAPRPADTPPAPPPDPTGGPAPDQAQAPGLRIRVGLRIKLLVAFALAFTVIFAFLSVWIFQYSSTKSMQRLETQLTETAEGGATTIDGDDFARLLATVPAVPDPDGPQGFGYPADDPLFLDIARQVLRIYQIVPDSSPYTYYRDPADGRLYFAVSPGFLLDPPQGVAYKVPVDAVVGPETYTRMEQGLAATTSEPAYTDAFGSWISSYTPIRDASGAVVGALGVDYPLTYVDGVRADVQRTLYPVLLISYVALLGLVLIISTSLTRPLKRLTSATVRVAGGEYDLDMTSMMRTRVPDEMYTLAESFMTMARKVGARERSLTREVQRLKVEIDQKKRDEQVRDITESDFFSGLQAKAAEMRQRARE